MYYARLSFDGIPRIGFAHHFYTENYGTFYAPNEHSFELVYIKQGSLNIDLYGKRFIAEPGSILVLFRHIPIKLTCALGEPQSHCSVQIIMDYSFTLHSAEEELPPDNSDCITLPMVFPAGEDIERIRREMYSIVAELEISREENGMSAALQVMGLLGQLSSLHRNSMSNGSSVLSYRVKRHIASHLGERITLQELADLMDKTPNYLNSVFKKNNGVTIHQYINREKAKMMGELMENRGFSFEAACESVGVDDVSYGYRLFKRHLGTTPKGYLRTRHYLAKNS